MMDAGNGWTEDVRSKLVCWKIVEREALKCRPGVFCRAAIQRAVLYGNLKATNRKLARRLKFET